MKPVTVLLLCVAYAFAQEPSAVAIRNAKIVTVSGPVIAKGTVVVRKGLIEAVGENVAVPADAMVVEGEGLTVYPGLIDSLSTVGQPGAAAPAPTTVGRGGGRGQTTSPTNPTTMANPLAAFAAASAPAPAKVPRGPEDRPQTTSWVKIADEVNATDRRIETVRSAGFTTVASFPTRGIFAGQGAVIDLLSGEKPGEMVVMSPIGQYISVTRSGGFGGGFPSSLMGYIAYIRQLYIDMNYYRMMKDAYAKNPRGMQRPEYDRALEGLMDSPRILLPANREVEMDRMLRLAQELKQPTVIYGGREAFRPDAVATLKKYDVPLLLSMKWPEKARDTDPDQVDSMRVLETREKAPSAPGVLAKAGVKFALYSDGLEQPRDLQRAVKKAIDAGLSREDALRALTLSPAEIYGVADRVGVDRKGQDRQPGGDARRPVRRPHQGGDDFRGRPQVHAGGGDGSLRRARRDRHGRPGESGGDAMKKLLFAAAAVLAPVWAQDYVIQNATVMTVSKGTIKNGSIVVKDGKIAEIGEKVTIPPGAKIIDASNQYVIPGIIDCHSHIAGDGGINEGSTSVSSMVDIKDIINPEDIAIYRALAGGVTTANILHGSANSIGGKTLPLKMRWGKDAQGMIFEGAMPGIKFALGENPKRAGNPTGRRCQCDGAISFDAYGRGGCDPRGFQRRQGLQGRVGRVRCQEGARRAGDSAAAGPATGSPEGSAGGQALRPRAQLSRR